MLSHEATRTWSRRVIVDAQLHLWRAESDDWKWISGRKPQISDPLTIEKAVPMMDEAGVDRVVVVPPTWVGDRNDYAIEAVKRYPDRFAIVGRIPVENPEAPMMLETWKDIPGMKGVRLTFHGEHLPLLTGGHTDWLWPAAEKAKMPIMFYAPRHISILGEVAQRHPDLPLIIDHMGLQNSMVTTGEIPEVIDQVVALAKYQNISVKLSSVMNYSLEDYPYRDMDVPLKRCFDAYGPRRSHWGTDATMTWSKATYKQRVEHFTKELTFMSEEDKDWVMGKSLLEKLNWS